MSALDGEVKATFKVKQGTDIRKFQAGIRAIYGGTAEDSDVSYILDSVESVICGWDPEERQRNGRHARERRRQK